MKTIRNIVSALTLFGLLTSARGQIDTELIPPEQDQRDLFARAAASRIVIIGRVGKIEGRSERVAPELLQERLNQGTVGGGSLIRVKVDEIICLQSDFDKQAPKVDDLSQPIYLFIPFKDTSLPSGQYRERLIPDTRYLLLLTETGSRDAIAKYDLEADRSYYRGEEYNRGVIPIENESQPRTAQNPPEVIGKFRKLCSAMKPPDPADKLALLQTLIDSGDPVLQKEAEEARKAIKTAMENKDIQERQLK
jgi:hypothetical protein